MIVHRKPLRRRVAVRVAVTAGLLAWTVLPALAAPPPYTITDLGLPAGGTYSEARDVNDSGEVTGHWKQSRTGFYGFLYTGGAMHSIGTLGGDTFGVAINNAGHVVGNGYTSSGTERAFLYDGGIHSLFNRWSGAKDINESEQIVGWSTASVSNPTRAFVYSDGVRTDIPLLFGDRSGAFGINNLGQVVGDCGVSGTANTGAFLYADGQVSGLNLGADVVWSMAYDINDAGTIIGVLRRSDKTTRAFMYEGGLMTELFPGSSETSYTRDINEAGQIVGTHGNRAFLYSEGSAYELDTLLEPDSGWTLYSASGINNLGQIVGRGVAPSGEGHAYLLTPIPEPATLALLAVGGLALALRRRHARTS